MTWEERLREEVTERAEQQDEERDTEVYESVEDYDPVLRSHCRL